MESMQTSSDWAMSFLDSVHTSIQLPPKKMKETPTNLGKKTISVSRGPVIVKPKSSKSLSEFMLFRFIEMPKWA